MTRSWQPEVLTGLRSPYLVYSDHDKVLIAHSFDSFKVIVTVVQETFAIPKVQSAIEVQAFFIFYVNFASKIGLRRKICRQKRYQEMKMNVREISKSPLRRN